MSWGAVCAFVDVTGRKQAERALHDLNQDLELRVRERTAALAASQAHQAFLLQLADALRPLSDSAQVKETACRVVGEHLNADRSYYVEVDEARGEFVVEREWHTGRAPPATPAARRWRTGLRISAIVDARFRLIVDGKSGAVGGALGKRARCRLDGTQSSTISVK